ncbi:MAG: thioredoxin family protein [Bacteroidota bacterium]
MKKLAFVLIVGIIFICHSCQTKTEYPKNDDGSLTWISIDEAAKLKNLDNKLYFVDVYTSWCKWCKVMDQKTFTDPGVIKFLDDEFHVVKFNAEQTDIVNWAGTEYIYQPGGRRGIHSLAPKLLNGRLSYPSFAVLDKDRNPLKIIVGYKSPEQLLRELDGLVAKSVES